MLYTICNYAINLKKILRLFSSKLLFLLIIFADITKKTEINIVELISDFGDFSHSKLEKIRGS